MENRREFLKVSAAAALVANQVRGANDRVQMGIIGLGTRGNQVYGSFIRNNDVTFVAACDVQKRRLDQFVAKSGGKMRAYGDYRRLLENKDVEGVLITTPDHLHSPIMLAALDAGKDVYCEKPVSNAIEPALKMVAAVRKSKQVVQIGCQQRSWPHFQEWSKKIQEGYIGQINQCVLLHQEYVGNFSRWQQEQPGPAPADLDWEMFQGPAERHPFVPSRLGWRLYWDYGGGSISDWGVHLTDVMLWYMNADRKTPLLTSASAVNAFNQPDPERVPDSYSITWKFDNFVATLTNAVPPSGGLGRSEMYGDWFYGQKGVFQVNRFGYELRPVLQAPGRGGAPANIPAPLKPERVMDPENMSENPDSKFGSATVRHTRNFLDCVKSRQKPVCDMETGFNSTLPTLLAVLSIRQGRSFTWDGTTAKPV